MRARPYRKLRQRTAVDSAVQKHGCTVESLLPILQDVQVEGGHLDKEVLGAASDALRLPDAQTFGVASFYAMLATKPRAHNIVRLCDGPVCCLHGAKQVRDAIDMAATSRAFQVERSSCLGLCDRAPAALVNLEPCGPLSPDRDLFTGWRGVAPGYAEPRPGEVRIAMARIGRINPDEIESALQLGAYQSLQVALGDQPSHILTAVSASGLQGRGGAGFPTGPKWQAVADAHDRPKYIVCNADESEPGSFKDRVLMEGDPHLVLEGMALAGYAVGAERGYIYIRGEYEPAAHRLERAIEQALRRRWLGNDIQGSAFSFDIQVHRGAGAYICGEETALLESLEGRRGEPRVRPPYPTTQGLFGKPTVVNNVETFCKVPAILAHGPQWYRTMGTHHSPGTKLFAVTGHINQPGVFEAPFGITLHQIIDQFAGGMRPGSIFKIALTGGAAGTVVGQSALDVPLDFAAAEHGVSLGAGAMLIADESINSIQLLSWLMPFFATESCGKCTPCRVGTVEARRIVDRMVKRQARRGDLGQLRHLAKLLRLTSFCGLGRSVAWPIESAMENFPGEWESLEPPEG